VISKSAAAHRTVLIETASILEQFQSEREIILGVCGSADEVTTYMPSARNVIVIGVPYGKKLSFERDGKIRGVLSQIAVGVDYHKTLKDMLSELDSRLKRRHEDSGFAYESKRHVDAGPLPEKTLAVRAGLGFIGRNNLVISEKYGSFFNIGCLVTNIDADIPYERVTGGCGKNNCVGCAKCVEACPGKALDNGYDREKCASYLTQIKRALTEDEKRIIGNRLYGCDDCQSACPFNKDKYAGEINEIDAVMPETESILGMDKTRFGGVYGKSSLYWRGLDIFKRNARIVNDNAPPSRT